MNGIEIRFRIRQTSGFAHLLDPLLPVSNVQGCDFVHFPVSEKRNNFGVKNISLSVHCGATDMMLPVVEV